MNKLNWFAIIGGIIGMVVLFKILGGVIGEAQTTGDDLYYRGSELTSEAGCEYVGCFWNATRETSDCSTVSEAAASTTACTARYAVPLASLFRGSGVVFMLLMAGVLMFAFYEFRGRGQK